MVGDWMGSIYGSNGSRLDIRLFIDHDSRYEWTERAEPGHSSQQVGRWTLDEGETVIRFQPDATDNLSPQSRSWSILSVTTCEDANTLLVLREAILASRNLPILFYRVHCDGRGYGTGWQERLTHPKA
jgi:hypothetical protein